MQIEDECKLGSSDEIEAAVHQIFSYINGSRLVKWLKKVDFMA